MNQWQMADRSGDSPKHYFGEEGGGYGRYAKA